ncbi:MAG: glycosyltransferase family 2 protein [Thermodesulfobacteriota bacterium]
MTPVTISILTYNRSSLLKILVTDLTALSYQPLEIIVVDNHSEDATEQIMRTEFPDVIYERTETNLGAGARNIGMKRARGDIVITLDDDVRGVTDTAICEIVRLFQGRNRLAAVNFKVLDHQTGEICNWVHHCLPEGFCGREFNTYEITEGAVAFRKTALERAGYYPQHFFLSHEGPDLAMRLLDHGYDVIYSPNIEVIHCHSQLGRKTWTNYYYDNRNLLWLAARNFPLSYAIVYLIRGLGSMLVYSIRDGYFIYWLKGLRDGFRGMGEALRERRVLRKRTIRFLKEIDENRPDIRYMIRKRLLKKGIRL